MRVSDDGVLSVAFDPTGRLVAGGGATGPTRVWRVSDQRPAFPPLTGQPARSPARSSMRLARISLRRAIGRDEALGSSVRAPVRRGVGRKHEVARAPGAVHRSSLPGPAQRVQPGRQAAGRLRSRDARDAVERGSRALARARVRDSRSQPKSRGVESPPAGRDRLSRNVSGVALGLTRPCGHFPNRHKLFPLRNQRRPLAGIVSSAPDRHPDP